MDAQAQAHRRRQELKEEAYYLVLKTLVLRDKPDTTLLNRLRVELSIGTDCHKQWMTELLTAKRAGTLGVHVDDRPGFKPQAMAIAAAPAATVAAWPAARQLAQQPSQQLSVQQSVGAVKAKAREEEQLGGLPADPLHLKVQYWRSTDGWAEGVITDYQPALKKIRVNVLQTKKVEWLDYTPSPCLIVHPNARVTDMTQYM